MNYYVNTPYYNPQNINQILLNLEERIKKLEIELEKLKSNNVNESNTIPNSYKKETYNML